MSKTTTANGQGDSALQTFKVQLTHSISLVRIGDLIVGAFEGGSNYWMRVSKREKPETMTFFYDAASIGGESGKVYWHVDYPLNGGSVTISDAEGDMPDGVLNSSTIQMGLEIMAEKYPWHMQDFLQENDDATTADVFLQCCIYGEIVFG